MPTTSNLLTISEAAEALRLSTSWLYKKSEQRVVPHYKIGNRLMFDPEELQGFLASCRVEPLRGGQS